LAQEVSDVVARARNGFGGGGLEFDVLQLLLKRRRPRYSW
jgi:hypothetical protein